MIEPGYYCCESNSESESGWWSRQESNLRPSHCEREVLIGKNSGLQDGSGKFDTLRRASHHGRRIARGLAGPGIAPTGALIVPQPESFWPSFTQTSQQPVRQANRG